MTLKRDIKELEEATRRDIKALEGRLEVRIAEAKADLLKWLVGLLMAQGGLVVALIELL